MNAKCRGPLSIVCRGHNFSHTARRHYLPAYLRVQSWTNTFHTLLKLDPYELIEYGTANLCSTVCLNRETTHLLFVTQACCSYLFRQIQANQNSWSRTQNLDENPAQKECSIFIRCSINLRVGVKRFHFAFNWSAFQAAPRSYKWQRPPKCLLFANKTFSPRCISKACFIGFPPPPPK